MKLTFEIHGYEITIDETEEGVMVMASKDGESVEEFTLDINEEVDDNDDMGSEEEIDSEEVQSLPQGQEEIQGQEEEDFPVGESKLESFNSFIKKRK